jgi:hypothetical protein
VVCVSLSSLLLKSKVCVKDIIVKYARGSCPKVF